MNTTDRQVDYRATALAAAHDAFRANPSASNYRKLERAMFAYQHVWQTYSRVCGHRAS